MDPKLLRRKLRGKFDVAATTLLAYYGIMNVAVIGVMFLDLFVVLLRRYNVQGQDFVLTDEMIAQIAGNGWGYILAIAIGSLIMFFWKKRKFCFHEIWRSEKRMKLGSFGALLCFFISGQAFVQVFSIGIEWVLNQFGMSAMESMEAASGISESISMFIYAGIFAPVFEEILFRGLILRMLMPTGKKFAIFASAYFFGMFHGNIIQTPFAFLVGLVLGYVTVEYSMWWAILLHMINNLVLGEVIPYLIDPLPMLAQDLIFNVLIWGCFVGATIIAIVKRKAIKQYVFEKRMQKICFKCFFSAPVVWVFTGLMLLNIVLLFLL